MSRETLPCKAVSISILPSFGLTADEFHKSLVIRWPHQKLILKNYSLIRTTKGRILLSNEGLKVCAHEERFLVFFCQGLFEVGSGRKIVRQQF